MLFYGLLLRCVLLWLNVFFFRLICLCVSFEVYCETVYVLFACAFRVCGLCSVFVCNRCDLLCDVGWCVCLSFCLCGYVWLKFNVFVWFVCGLSCDAICCVDLSFCVCVCCCLKMGLLYL